MRIIIINIFGAKYEEKIGQPRLGEEVRLATATRLRPRRGCQEGESCAIIASTKGFGFKNKNFGGIFPGPRGPKNHF
jgi:hypothetical protein